MTQTHLNQAVARATGEAPSTIARLGFSILTRRPVERERRPLVIDWDEHCVPEIARRPRRPRHARSVR